MHEREDRRTGSTRPSLLSSDQQADTERSSILGNLDSKSGKRSKPKEPARSGKLRWVTAGVTLAALCGAAVVWSDYDAGVASVPAVVAAPVKAPHAPPAPAVEVASVPPVEPEVSTAAILEEPPRESEKSLHELLGATPASKAAPDELARALEKPERRAPKKERKPVAKVAKTKPGPVKVARKDKPRAVAAAPKKKPAPVDSDVALLAALVAHAKAKPESQVSKTGAKLKQCAALGSVAEADKCRERLCSGSAKNEAECKGQRVVKVASET